MDSTPDMDTLNLMHEPSIVSEYPLLRFLPLVIASILTLHAQALWCSGDVMNGLFLSTFWIILIVGWLIRLVQHHFYGTTAVGIKEAVLPLSILILIITGETSLPLRVLFWTQQSALEKALKRPTLQRQIESKQPPIGLFRPLQISKSKKSTRFILWENPILLSGTAVGFAHCPGDNECSRASFEPFYEEGEERPETIQLSNDWVAVSISGSDF